MSFAMQCSNYSSFCVPRQFTPTPLSLPLPLQGKLLQFPHLLPHACTDLSSYILLNFFFSLPVEWVQEPTKEESDESIL
jgi:hypothetical protein